MIDKKELTKLLSFMATFDGGIYYRNPSAKNPAFIMNMREENLDYVEWVRDTLHNITGAAIADRKDYNTDGYSRKTQVRLDSNQHPFLKTLHDRIYINKHKVIDPHMLKLLDAEALAIIFMADGCSSLIKGHKSPSATIRLFTCGFSYADNMSLSKAIYNKLNIITTVGKHGKYWKLNVKSSSIVDFARIVQPYVCDSFLYKIEQLAPFLEHREGGDIVCSVRERIEAGGRLPVPGEDSRVTRKV